MTVRKATVKDVDRIHFLVNGAAESGAVLHRSKDEIYESIRDFFVFESGGEIRGTVALHVTIQNLAEIRSLVVEPAQDRKGIGTRLVRSCMKEAESLQVETVFVLTYVPEFFIRFSFSITDKDRFPHKIWLDCSKCQKFLDCDETALIYTLARKESEEPVNPPKKVRRVQV